MIPFNKDNIKNKSALTTRWAQMTKQEQIIERKKMEIQVKHEQQKQAAALAAQHKLAMKSRKSDDNKDDSGNIFSNDGSFMNQFKALLEKQKKEKREQEAKAEREKIKIANVEDKSSSEGQKQTTDSRDKRSRWSDHKRSQKNSPATQNFDGNSNIPPLMGPGQNNDDSSQNQPPWEATDNQHDSVPNNMGPMGPGPMIGPGANVPPGGPPFMGPNFPMPPNFMGPNGPHSQMPPSMPGPNGPMPPNMSGPNGSMPPNMSGPNGPMPPNMFGPNGPMPPHMFGPNGPPGPMPPNMCGPNGPMPPNMYGLNGPIPPFFGPNGPMPPFPMGPNRPPLPPNSNMPFRPPFGPNGPNFNGPPNEPFMPSNESPENSNTSGKDLDVRKTIAPPPPPPPPPVSEEVLSPDALPPSVLRAANEVASNGDQWEHVLKNIQDQSLWFLHNTNTIEYKKFRELVSNIRQENREKKPEIKPEDKYDPEFSLQDEDEDDFQPAMKKERADYSPSYNYEDDNPPDHKPKYELASSQSDDDGESKRERERKRKRKSRWGDDPPVDIKPPEVAPLMPPGVAPLMPPGVAPLMPPGLMAGLPPGFVPPPPPISTMPPMPPGPPLPGVKLAKIDEEGLKLTNVNRNNHALMQYAMTNYGSTNLSAEDWKKCEDNFKLHLLYQDMIKKRQEVERMAQRGKHKYEYDSDEDTSEGTWEHKLRSKEMNATEKWADELTKQASGKHHIGDFLPPEELKKFMEKYSAVKSGKEPDLSDYKEFKLKEDNIGFKMLQKLGWNEGQGLGAEGTGIVAPINKSNQPVANMGLGSASADLVSPEDDEFDAYRKRMMLAYRFRPNPLNNPRRPYY